MTKEARPIRSLRPNVTREQAIQAFTATAISSLYWKLRIGSLQRIGDAYIPFRIYKVRYSAGGGRHTHHFALDAVDGSLDLFEFAKPPGDTETITIASRNHPPPALTEMLSENLLRDKVLRLIFQRGFFKVREVHLETEQLPGEIYLPYWLGFYGTSEGLRCRALDAVRRRFEGARASALFEHWLAA
jgi:hypothetical protein